MSAIHRLTWISRDVRAGCFVCYGSDARWFGGQAQGTAARHHDATGHATWCDIAMSVRYGREAPDPRQLDIEHSIAGLGDRPDAIPLPDLDAPTVAPAGVSAPQEPVEVLLRREPAQGRPVETRARGRKPEPAHV